MSQEDEPNLKDDIVTSEVPSVGNKELTTSDLENRLKDLEILNAKYQSDLLTERVYRQEQENKMIDLVNTTEIKLKEAQSGHSKLLESMNNVERNYTYNLGKLRDELSVSTSNSNRLESDFMDVSNRYKNLLLINKQTAMEMQQQEINIPDTMEELQFYALTLREELIQAKSVKEHESNESKNEIALLSDHCKQLQEANASLEYLKNIHHQYKACQHELNKLTKSVDKYRAALEESGKTIERLSESNDEMRQKAINLQTELDTSETVQKDFVRLSQSLQIQLEKIRQSSQEVRWQFEDDVGSCNGCNSVFSKAKPKVHCLHCGKIFCPPCLPLSVPSGPKRRPARVCNVCHTLLNPDSAPFFSNQK
uniref:FYVE-type domain-containing protein n=1 Tax=Rhabditophanes sp. KR3021 TaxID=114890 RepID=A0AC35U4A5_9BILA